MPTSDQVAWAECNVRVGDELKSYTRGALLPDPVGNEETANRATLRMIGAIRTMEVVYTAEEMAAAAKTPVAKAKEAPPPPAHVVPAATPPAPAAAPVVVGPEDDKPARPDIKSGSSTQPHRPASPAVKGRG